MVKNITVTTLNGEIQSFSVTILTHILIFGSLVLLIIISMKKYSTKNTALIGSERGWVGLGYVTLC